ncbi:MAG: alpha/beta hydrolase-fold protein [Candidatus Dormiibacterota bacterium]
MSAHWWQQEFAGRVTEHVLESRALAGNPLGDPTERPLWVYVPPGYDESDARYPSVYVIQGYTGQGAMWWNRAAYRESFPAGADRVIASGEAPPVIMVYIDAWTAYGGSQYVDSPGTGRYHTYICEEIVPWVDAHYRTLPEAAHRGIMGKSSGGFGAMITPMRRPDLFGGLATHAGDGLYECCYVPEFAKTVRALREYDGDIFARWKDFRSRVAFTKESDGLLLMTLGVSACFSARDDGTPELPFDPHTGRLRDDIWAKWLAWDPVRMVPRYADALRTQRAIWIDAGTRDDWYLDLAATAFRDELAKIGVTDVKFELFDATHMGIDYRYAKSLAYLAARLQ